MAGPWENYESPQEAAAPSGPWEKYQAPTQTASPAPEQGPWNNYGPSIRALQIPRMKAELKKQPQFQQEEPGFYGEHVAPHLYNLVEALSPQGMLSWPHRVIGVADPNIDESFLPEGPLALPSVPIDPRRKPFVRRGVKPGEIDRMAPPPEGRESDTQGDTDSLIYGVRESLGEGLRGLTTPRGMLTFPALFSPLGRAIIAAKTAMTYPETVAEKATEAGTAAGTPGTTPAQVSKPFTDIAQETAMLGLPLMDIHKGQAPPPPQRPSPSEFTAPYGQYGDRPIRYGGVSTERPMLQAPPTPQLPPIPEPAPLSRQLPFQAETPTVAPPSAEPIALPESMAEAARKREARPPTPIIGGEPPVEPQPVVPNVGRPGVSDVRSRVADQIMSAVDQLIAEERAKAEKPPTFGEKIAQEPLEKSKEALTQAEIEAGGTISPKRPGISPEQLRRQQMGERMKGPPSDIQELHAGIGPEKEDLAKLALGRQAAEAAPPEQFALTASRLLESPERLKYTPDRRGEVDAGQVVNRLLAQVPAGERSIIEGPLREKFKPGERTTFEEVRKVVDSVKPKMEVKVFEGGKIPDESAALHAELASLTHHLDTIAPGWEGQRREGTLPERARSIMDRRQEILDDPKYREKHFDPNKYRDVAPKRTDQSVVMLRVPGGEGTPALHMDTGHFGKEGRNILGWARIQYEQQAGKKIAHIIEVQSKWAQDVAKARESQSTQFTAQDHPLLKDWERRTVKAAIDEAISKGADEVMVSDPRTAMMTQGHDLPEARFGQEAKDVHTTPYHGELHKDNIIRELEKDGRPYYVDELNKEVRWADEEPAPRQQAGMEQHYGKTLQDITKGLTRGEGRDVNLGEHAKAREREGVYHREGEPTEMRDDLYFKDKEGKPLTDVTGKSYDLGKIKAEREKAPFTMFGDVHELHAGLPGKDLAKRLLDMAFGHGVERVGSEAFEHRKAFARNETVPHHVAANEDVANKLVKYASADVTTEMLPHLRGTDYRFNALTDWIRSGINARLYQYKEIVPGVPPTIGGQRGVNVAIPLRTTGATQVARNLVVRADLAPEVEQALRPGGKVKREGAQRLLDAATELQIYGPADLVMHSSNMYSSIVRSPGKTGNYFTDLAMRMPVAKQVDAIARIGYNMYRVMSKDPAVMAATRSQLAGISEIGSLRPEATEYSGPVSRFLKTGPLIRLVDRAGRLARDGMFDNLVKQGLTDDTLRNRREFINKMGQYNQRLMPVFKAWMRNHFSQFVVAGEQFNRNAYEAITGGNEVRAANKSAFAKMKISNILSAFATIAAIPMVLNSIRGLPPMGRPGVPPGAIDTGKDDKDGRPIYIDLMRTDLSRRGARITGINALAEGLKEGRSMKEIGSRMASDVVTGKAHPWLGPPIRVMLEAIKGLWQSGGKMKEATKGAAYAVNPLAEPFSTGIGLTEEDESKPSPVLGEGGPVRSVVSRTLETVGSAAGVGRGRGPSHLEQLEKETGVKPEEMPLRERVKAEFEHVPKKLGETSAERYSVAEVRNDAERGREASSQLSKADKQWLESRDLRLSGFNNKLSISGQRVYLTRAETEKLVKYVTEEYTTYALPELRSRYESMEGHARDKYFTDVIATAHQKAKARLTMEIRDKY